MSTAAMPKKSAPISVRSSRVCPVCGKPATARDRPFCSPRCADVDLHRWLSDAYRVPAVEADDEDDGDEDDGRDGDDGEPGGSADKP